jgi:hypothetical protein
VTHMGDFIESVTADEAVHFLRLVGVTPVVSVSADRRKVIIVPLEYEVIGACLASDLGADMIPTETGIELRTKEFVPSFHRSDSGQYRLDEFGTITMIDHNGAVILSAHPGSLVWNNLKWW